MMALLSTLLVLLGCFAIGSCVVLGIALPGEKELTGLANSLNPFQVCYGSLGCFSVLGNFLIPQIRPVQLLPQSPEKIRPSYALYTRRNMLDPHYIVYKDSASVSTSHFNAKLHTKIIVHGFLSTGNVGWMADMRKALIKQGDYNVVQMDWSGGNGLPYMQATANTRVVGALLAQLIAWLESEFGADREKFHLLGHSLGAHIAGYAGERLSEGKHKLGRITGLDPAGPYFQNTHTSVRLDPTDARFVDAIHTDGDSILSLVVLQGGFGMMQPVGHVDFYPNGGKSQPDCDPVEQIAVKGIIEGTKWVITCDHGRANSIMTSTILNPRGNYKAFPCDSYEDFKAGRCFECRSVGCPQMGIRASEWNRKGRKNVKVFLDTNGNPPYESTGEYNK